MRPMQTLPRSNRPGWTDYRTKLPALARRMVPLLRFWALGSGVGFEKVRKIKFWALDCSARVINWKIT